MVLGEGLIANIRLGETNIGFGLYTETKDHKFDLQAIPVPLGKKVRLIAEVLE